MGLAMAAVAPVSMVGPFAHLCQYVENVREALLMFARFQFVMSDGLQTQLIEGEEESSFRMEHALDSLEPGHAAEMALGVAAQPSRLLLVEPLGLGLVGVRVGAQSATRYTSRARASTARMASAEGKRASASLRNARSIT